MTSVLPELEGTLSIKERRQLLLQKGLAIAGGGEQESKLPSSTTTTTNTTPSVHGRSSSIHKANAPSSTPSSNTTNNNTTSKNSSNVNNESFSSIKDRIKLLDKKPPTEPTVVQNPTPQPQQQQQTYIPSSSFVIPQPPPSLPSTSNNITLTRTTTTTTPINQQQQPFIPPPPSSLFSFDKIKELHRDEYEEFEYQLKQTELELEASNPNLPEEQQYPQPEYTIPDSAANEEEEYFPPTSFQLDGKNRKSLIVGAHPSSSSSSFSNISTSTTNSTAINNNNNNLLSTKSLNKSLPPTSTNRNNNNNNSMVISNHVMMKERNISPPSSSSSMMASNQPLNSNNNIINNNIGSMQTSPINQIYHYPIKVQTTASTSSKSDEVQYPSAPSFDEIDFPEYQIVNNVQMQTMTSNIFKPITDSLSETVSEEEDYRMFSQFKEFITSQHMPVMNDEKLYSLYISFRERYQHQAQQTNVNNVNNNKQQSPTVVLVNKSRVPSLSAGTATKAKPIVNPNSPTVSTTSGSSTNSSGSNSEKKRDGLRDVRKKYEEQKLEEMRIKQMKERNKAHYAQEMQQPCMDYNALVMRENAMYQQPTSNQMMMNGNNTNSYPTINNPNDVISNGTYVPFKASHPHQSNSHITSRAISNSTGAGYLNYNTNNYWPNNK